MISSTEITHLFPLLVFWLEHDIKSKVKHNTYRCYELAIKHIKKYGKDAALSSIKEIDAQNILNTLGKMDYAKSTIDKARIVLRQALEYAARNGLIRETPIRKLFIPQNAPAKKVDAISVEEQERVESLCKALPYGYVTIFLLHSGLRFSGLSQLKWDDYFDGKGKAYINIRKSKTKNGIRMVPLLQICNNIIDQQPRINPFIFNAENGLPFTGKQLSAHNKIIREQTQVSAFNNHICRHTFATRALEAGMSMKALSKILGHADVAFTMRRYAHASTDYLFEQMKVMETGTDVPKRKDRK